MVRTASGDLGIEAPRSKVPDRLRGSLCERCSMARAIDGMGSQRCHPNHEYFRAVRPFCFFIFPCSHGPKLFTELVRKGGQPSLGALHYFGTPSPSPFPFSSFLIPPSTIQCRPQCPTCTIRYGRQQRPIHPHGRLRIRQSRSLHPHRRSPNIPSPQVQLHQALKCRRTRPL